MSLDVVTRKPKIGLLGIMQELYDKMLPGITERQEAYGRDVARRLSGVADGVFPGAVRCRDDIERTMAGFAAEGVDGVLIVMLTYGPGLRLVNAFRDCSLPLMLANIQPEPQVTTAWDMGDLTYNQGVHGAQDTTVPVRHAQMLHERSRGVSTLYVVDGADHFSVDSLDQVDLAGFLDAALQPRLSQPVLGTGS